MTTILATYGSPGRAGRRCDATCHEAAGEDCNCICGGAFHGVGGRIAVEDRDTLTDEEIREINRWTSATIKRLEIQATLFDPPAGKNKA